jgi:hypothetical protein
VALIHDSISVGVHLDEYAQACTVNIDSELTLSTTVSDCKFAFFLLLPMNFDNDRMQFVCVCVEQSLSGYSMMSNFEIESEVVHLH